MDSVWYYEDHGRAKGPVTERELIAKIKKGELQLLDLIYKEGDGEWHPIEYFTELTDLIGSVSARDAADWILLRNIEVDGKHKFEQMGPYSIEQVLELVDKGKATFSDYVWRTGFDNWVSLGKVDKFEKPLVSSVEVDLSLYKMPRLEIIEKPPAAPVKAYSKYKKEEVKEEEAPPPEAKGPDLAKPSWEAPERVAPHKPTSKIEAKTQAQSDAKPEVKTEKKVEVKAAANVAAVAPQSKAETPVVDNTVVAIKKTITPPAPKIKEEIPVVAKVSLKESPKETKTKNNPYEHTLTIETSLLRADKKNAPISAPTPTAVAPVAKEKLNDDLTGDFIPQQEMVDKMQRRWSLVWQYLGYGFVVFGIFLFGSWGINTFFPRGDKNSKLTPALSSEEIPAPPVYLPPPSEDVPKEALQAAKDAEKKAQDKKAADKKDVAKKEGPIEKKDIEKVPGSPAPAPVAAKEDDSNNESELMTDFAKMDFKEKSTFHHSERFFIFYTTTRAVGVANELPALYRKKGKNLNGWKTGFSAWQASLRKITSGELKSNEKRLYPDLYNRFKKAMVSLDDRAKDFNAQLVSGRNPTKELTVSDIVAELNRLHAKAKALDQ